MRSMCVVCCSFFFQAEDGIRDLVRSRGLGDVYKRQVGDVEVAQGRGGHRVERRREGRGHDRGQDQAGEDLSLIHI